MKKTIMLLLASVGVLSVFQFSAPVVNAQFDSAKDEACEGLAAGDDFINCGSEQQSGTGVGNILEIVLNVLSIVAGVIAVIMIIIGGIKFMTSQGDGGKTASARNTIIYALVGIIIVALAQTIVFFVLREATTAPPPELANPPTQDCRDGDPC
jgi:hypothetical protein